MAKIVELKIKQKTEDMIQYLYVVLKQFPKSEKFTLAASIKKSALLMLTLIIRCNKAKDKTRYLYDIDVAIDVLRSEIRLSKNLIFMPFKKYEKLSLDIDEIGRMLGGWIKANSRK